MIYILNGEDITNKQFMTADGISYPYNWCECATPEQLTELGIVTLTEIQPDLLPGYGYTGEYTDNYVENTRTYLQAQLSPGLSGIVTGSIVVDISMATWLTAIAVKCTTPNQAISIGITENGTNILDTHIMTDAFVTIPVTVYIGETSTLYITGPDVEYSYSILVS